MLRDQGLPKRQSFSFIPFFLHHPGDSRPFTGLPTRLDELSLPFPFPGAFPSKAPSYLVGAALPLESPALRGAPALLFQLSYLR